jgi:hypothetical protein
MTVMFAMFFNDFLENMETRGTWQSFNESHFWCTCIVESCTICIHNKLLTCAALRRRNQNKMMQVLHALPRCPCSKNGRTKLLATTPENRQVHGVEAGNSTK